MKSGIVVVIPSLNPDERLLELVEALVSDFPNVVIINDGSSEKYDEIYQRAIEVGKGMVTVLNHCINCGKGRALKTAFNYALTSIPKEAIRGFVCIDSDGQHSVDDIIRCAEELCKNPQALVLGCRNFDGKDIPTRSRFGNKITKSVLKLMCGISVQDTQTGLRALSAENARQYVQTVGERYEYEMNMLIETKEKGIPIIEVPIETIYINDNKSSHFNPIVDSWRIYKVFLKFLFSGMSSFVIDIGLFSIFMHCFNSWKHYIIISTSFARLISSVYNYLLNTNYVFRAKSRQITMIRYYILAFGQMVASAMVVSYIVQLLGGFEIIVKIVTDVVLFAISFYIQREWVFKG